MKRAPGHVPGHTAEAPVGFTWGAFLERLVDEHGSLAAVARALVDARGWTDDAQTVERGLRRLRARANLDGGEYGQRLLARFGVPRDIEARVRWMGSYHTRFTDLPRSLCLEHLQSWNRPPVSESRARIWLRVGLAGVALRAQDYDAAEAHLADARLLERHAPPDARAELGLVDAFVANHRRDRARVAARLDAVGAWLDEPGIDPDDRACLFARWIDQRAFQINTAPDAKPDHDAVLALYQRIPEGENPFASSRRANGLAWTYWKLGDRAAAIPYAEMACRHAGDGGFVRLRAMALNLLSRIVGGDEGARIRQRAMDIARRLEDEELATRIAR